MIVSPSLLSADFARLGESVAMIDRSEAAWIHCDVMDGVFVPNISFGFPVIKSISRLTDKPLDVHLMIVEPQKYVSQVRDCGATIMNVHLEACTHLHRTVEAVKAAGMKAAVTLNPATPVTLLQDIIADLDMVLLMSVNPGFGGQKFIDNTYNKIKRLRELIAATGSHALIEIDGGVSTANAASLAAAGADVLVAGNAVFSADDPAAVISQLAGADSSFPHSK
ncbi:MAG: ribulose-phosphate 3-epimerase [Bacteroides sp.]|nr:ribulose-phosphate 3-epimerase [Bacteroides sp.]MCM1094748.1 ribulose-phosphate 3-epimerase [Terasakiella sp.]